MPSRLIVGPPGAGKTHRLVGVARNAARSGRRVTWVALPHQRNALYRRLTEEGALLGVEVVSAQQLLYRIVAAERRLLPLVTRTERLALVGQALGASRGALPTPGEARLFARGVAEAKRHGLGPGDVAAVAERLAVGGVADAHEARRLAEVFARYEESLAGRADYDDVRSTALELVRSGSFSAGADVIVVDGFRELGPLDIALYRGIGERCELWLALPGEPPSWPADERLAARPTRTRAHRFVNPVAEARWVLRSLKRDLAEGAEQGDLAIIAPPAARHVLLALADEFGVPLSDEAPRSLADTAAGRILLDLLDIPENPTASRLLSVPELAPLARAALALGAVGRSGMAALAAEIGMEGLWTDHLRALTPAGDDEAWAERVVDRALAYAAGLGSADEGIARDGASASTPPEAVRDALLARALEAMRLGPHDGVRGWWGALVQETTLPQRPRPGVALLDATLASGRRFRKAYVIGAAAGAHAPSEREDYFIPEEARIPWDEVHRLAVAPGGAPPPGLPRRHRGLAREIAAELLTRGDEVVVTAPEGDRGGPLQADDRLLAAPTPPPPQPAGSVLEATAGTPFRPRDGPALVRRVGAEELRRSEACTFRVWAERLVGPPERLPRAARLRRALTAERSLDARRAASLASEFPEAVPWLDRHGERLRALAYGVDLPMGVDGPSARLDAVERGGDVVRVIRFVTAGEDPLAVVDPARRWNELFAARSLLRHASVGEVRVVAWPLLGDPIELTPDGITRERGGARVERVARSLDQRWRRWRAGAASPTPGHHCAGCAVRDICREAPR